MIEGLKLTLTGKELRKRLNDRIDSHMRSSERWRHEQERTPEEQTEEAPLLPDEMCGNEAERHEWRAAVLEFIRDHVDPSEVYQLAAADVEFGELLPPKPGWVEQDEYEERTAVGFQLERLVKEVRRFPLEFISPPPDGKADAWPARSRRAAKPRRRGRNARRAKRVD